MKTRTKSVRIALVGAPGAGKTTVMEILKDSICPSVYTVDFVEEAATALMRSSALIRELRETDPVAFQEKVAGTQRLREADGVYRAQQNNVTHYLQITDRALQDAYVYLNGEQRKLMTFRMDSIADLNKRYDAVICFDYYDCGSQLTAGNDVRAEKALSDIKKVCERSIQVYSSHPHFYLIPPCKDIRLKAAQVAEIINTVARATVLVVKTDE